MGCSDQGFASAVIVAGGKGERFGGDVRKQYLKLGERTVLGRTLCTFISIDEIGEVVVVAPASDVEFIRNEIIPGDLGKLASEKPITVVAGGRTRQESARAGLAALDIRCRFVLVHDAVRPFTQVRHILQVLEKARQCGGAVLAVPVKDTLKRCDNGFVVNTCLRDGLYAAQTPQAFDTEKLRYAHYMAEQQGLAATDDAAIFEVFGYEVAIVEGSSLNIKITTEEDMVFARLLDLSRN